MLSWGQEILQIIFFNWKLNHVSPITCRNPTEVYCSKSICINIDWFILSKEKLILGGLNIRKPFTTPQRHTIRRVFSKYITDDTMGYPTTWDLLEAIKKFPELQDKQPQQIKSFIQHQRRLHKNK